MDVGQLTETEAVHTAGNRVTVHSDPVKTGHEVKLVADPLVQLKVSYGTPESWIYHRKKKLW
jgi:hypothetical protein